MYKLSPRKAFHVEKLKVRKVDESGFIGWLLLQVTYIVCDMINAANNGTQQFISHRLSSHVSNIVHRQNNVHNIFSHDSATIQ